MTPEMTFLSSEIPRHPPPRSRMYTGVSVLVKESSPMMMTHTEKASSLQCQEVGRRKGAKEVVVIWDYSVDLVCLV